MNRKQIRDLKKLTDDRNKGYVTYEMITICVTRLFSLLCGIKNMTEISTKLETDESIENISKIAGQKLENLPHWETIQDVFKNIKLSELRDIQKYIVNALIRSKMFDKYRHNGAFLIVFVSYYKYVLECKLVVGNIVISLDSEFVENNVISNENQDCETNAFKIMAERIKKNYPKLSFIASGDALYATTPIIELCEKYN